MSKVHTSTLLARPIGPRRSFRIPISGWTNDRRRLAAAGKNAPPRSALGSKSPGGIPPGRSFTLIELLVVISIIVLFLALFLPALTSAKEHARTAMCQSNLHQLVLAMTSYSIDEEGAYPLITPPSLHFAPPGYTCWQNWCSYGTVSQGYALSHARLFKTGYFNNWLFARCPGRDYEDWPANDIDNFLDPPPWPTDGPAIDFDGEKYPWRTCYQMRGWEETVADWRDPNKVRAINSDMMLNLAVILGGPEDKGLGAHPDGLNVGYSDASVSFVSVETQWDSNQTFREQLLAWQPNPHLPIGILEHLEVYQFFDNQ